jgi:hypothetical protein
MANGSLLRRLDQGQIKCVKGLLEKVAQSSPLPISKRKPAVREVAQGMSSRTRTSMSKRTDGAGSRSQPLI